MKTTEKTTLIAFLAAVAAGVLIHNLYGWFPNPVFALLSPVRESLWEHVKLLFYPLLAAALLLGRGDRAALTVRLWSMLAACAVLLAVSFTYHVLFRGENFIVDLILYLVLMAAGILLPRLLWPLGEKPGDRRTALLLTAALWAAILAFSVRAPMGALFVDMEGVRTFLTLPV